MKRSERIDSAAMAFIEERGEAGLPVGALISRGGLSARAARECR